MTRKAAAVLVLVASARAARTPGEQLHYAFPSVGCSVGSGTFPDLVARRAAAKLEDVGVDFRLAQLRRVLAREDVQRRVWHGCVVPG